jgi:hypothetical protein
VPSWISRFSGLPFTVGTTSNVNAGGQGNRASQIGSVARTFTFLEGKLRFELRGEALSGTQSTPRYLQVGGYLRF